MRESEACLAFAAALAPEVEAIFPRASAVPETIVPSTCDMIAPASWSGVTGLVVNAGGQMLLRRHQRPSRPALAEVAA